MDRRATVDVAALIDKTPLGWFHVALLLNTCMVMFMEGYDMQVTSYAAPAIIKKPGIVRARTSAPCSGLACWLPVRGYHPGPPGDPFGLISSFGWFRTPRTLLSDWRLSGWRPSESGPSSRCSCTRRW